MRCIVLLSPQDNHSLTISTSKQTHLAPTATTEAASSSDYETNLLEMSDADWDKLLNAGRRNVASANSAPSDVASEGNEAIWVGARDVRPQLLCKQCFHLCWKFITSIDSRGWKALLRLLLVLRELGALPYNLEDIDDFSDLGGSQLQPSVFERESKNSSGKTPGSESATQGGEKSIWLSVASLGGLLWSSSDGAAVAAAIGATSSSHPLTPRQVVLLRKGVEAVRPDLLIFSRLKSIPDGVILEFCRCVLWYLREFIGSRDEMGIDGSHFVEADAAAGGGGVVERPTGDNCVVTDADLEHLSELDAVLLLEWLSRVLFANRMRASILWRELHGIYYSIYFQRLLGYGFILVDFLSIVLSADYPLYESSPPAQVVSSKRGKYHWYFLERCVVTILRAAINLTIDPKDPDALEDLDDKVPKKTPSDFSKAKIKGPSGKNNEGQSASGGLDLVIIWRTLFLLEKIPESVLSMMGSRLGAGLLSLLRYQLR